MLLSPTVVLLSALTAHALPAGRFVSVLTTPSSKQGSVPIGKTPISRDDVTELGRLAVAVNTAYCPVNKHLEPHPAGQLALHSARHQRRTPTSTRAASIVISSSDSEFEDLAEDVDMNWYISHTPSTQTLTLAFSSLPGVDDLVDLLASTPANATSLDDLLIPLPDYLFPPENQPHLVPPRIHHSYLNGLETHGTSALLALLDLLESPPAPTETSSAGFGSLLRPFKKQSPPAQPKAIRNVEIVGHGLGSAIGLLVAAALHLEVTGPVASTYETPLPSVDISATLFGLPRVGDQSFADWVDLIMTTSSDKLRINRVTSYADTIAHLPERHLDLAHPSIGEIWIGADPRVAYACRSEEQHEESELCSGSISLGKSSLIDHAGPFGGVWIGPNSCRRPKVDASAL